MVTTRTNSPSTAYVQLPTDVDGLEELELGQPEQPKSASASVAVTAVDKEYPPFDPELESTTSRSTSSSRSRSRSRSRFVPGPGGLLRLDSKARKVEAVLVCGSVAFLALAVLGSIASAVRKWHSDSLFYGVLNRTVTAITPPPLPMQDGDDDYLAICAAVKDQRFSLPEWIRHHYYHLNIKHIYLMDDGSVPPLSDQLTNFELGVPRHAVHFIYFNSKDRHKVLPQQVYAYSECVRMFGSRHRWFAFIDVDEFFEVTERGLTIHSFLRSFEERAAAVGVNWIMHGSNQVLRKPKRGTCRSTFTECLLDPQDLDGQGPLDNGHVKVIAQSAYFGGMITPHHGWFTGELTNTVGENGTDIPLPGYLRIPATREKVSLHHYVTKSKEEYWEKIARGNGMDDGKREDFWEYMLVQPHKKCDSLTKYYP